MLAILPFYLQSILGIDGRFIRVFRLFRISRIIKLGRFSKSFDLLSKGIDNVKNEKINSIEEEHKNFYHSIINKEDPIVSFEKGRDALELAIKIVKIIEN